MNNGIGYIDIILLAMIAGFIVLRLRGVLGKKTGHQEKSIDERLNKSSTKRTNNGKIIDFNSKSFDEEEKKQFIQGAKIAYETIITSFAKGDKVSLRPLLNKNIYQSFSEEIDKRKKENLKSELTFVGVKYVSIKDFEKKDNIYTFTVNFVSEIITWKKDKNDKIIEGNQDEIKTVNDVWKFSKNMWSQNPNWYLVETKV